MTGRMVNVVFIGIWALWMAAGAWAFVHAPRGRVAEVASALKAAPACATANPVEHAVAPGCIAHQVKGVTIAPVVFREHSNK